ncbi:hypothetical protein GGI11_003586 [Coemansia sp. RSA 2049]|nr:hypothetical protein GGI11_003586 [Coemansia sp. RSA 2049]
MLARRLPGVYRYPKSRTLVSSPARRRAMESATIQLNNNDTVRLECPAHISASVPLSEIRQFPPLARWISALATQTQTQTQKKPGDPVVSVRRIAIQSVDRFKSGKIGFMKFTVDASHLPEGTPIPGVVFLRGGSVAALLILRPADAGSDHKDDLVAMTEQPRLAAPDFQLLELPAGMLDGAGVFAGAAAREIQEETGLVMEPHELVDLTDFAGNKRGLYPSPGACDEFVRLFACVKHVERKELDRLRGRLGGLREDGEFITIRLVPLHQLWRSTSDMKAISALYLWDQYQTNKK